MAKYREITFAEGYNRPFAEFKKEFQNTHVFKNMPPEEREKELEVAYKIATNNGNNRRTTRKSPNAGQRKNQRRAL